MEETIEKDLYEKSPLQFFNFSPYRFIRNTLQLQVEKLVLPTMQAMRQKGHYLEEQGIHFYFRKLDWDTAFFGRPIYKLEFTVSSARCTIESALKAIEALKAEVASLDQGAEIFTEIAPQETSLIQALNMAGFRLLETRLTYYKKMDGIIPKERFETRQAGTNDIPSLRQTAMEARNDFDRFHADTYMSLAEADLFLAKYVEEAVKGYCDYVMVPRKEPVDSFMCLDFGHEECLSLSYSKIILTAVGKLNRGWHARYCSETLHIAKERGHDVVLMTTQLTNGAVVSNVEKLKFKLAYASHILSFREL